MTTPTVPKTTIIIDWITSLGWDVTQETGYPLFTGPEVLSSPDRSVWITPTPGPGWLTEEGALDVWGFQALVRGPDNDPLDPQLKAEVLDSMILFAPKPVTIDGTLIAMVARAGATPTALPLATDDRRFTYATTYLITTGGE